MIGNCSFPDVRLLYSHPLTVTVSPAWAGSSLMRTVAAIGRRIIREERRRPAGWPGGVRRPPRYHRLPTLVSRARPPRERMRHADLIPAHFHRRSRGRLPHWEVDAA